MLTCGDVSGDEVEQYLVKPAYQMYRVLSCLLFSGVIVLSGCGATIEVIRNMEDPNNARN